jgi:uncharacterized protein DUF3795
MKYPTEIKSKMIAPCGMNCALCIAFHRETKPCAGCLGDDSNKSNSCITCIIKNCDHLDLNGRKKFCFVCEEIPCKRLKQLDKRYSTKFGMSMLENLKNIKVNGIREFVQNEKQRWTCQNCGGLISVHRKNCSYCDFPKN